MNYLLKLFLPVFKAVNGRLETLLDNDVIIENLFSLFQRQRLSLFKDISKQTQFLLLQLRKFRFYFLRMTTSFCCSYKNRQNILPTHCLMQNENSVSLSTEFRDASSK